MDMLNGFQALIGAYLLYCAITGKGKLYENDNVKEGMEQTYKKRMRQFAWALGPLMIAQCVLDWQGGVQENAAMTTAGHVVFGLVIVGVVAMLVISARMTDRTKAKTAATGTAEAGKKHAAFDFDNDEE
ncbi:hypothetical protein LJC07_02335 [Christensenellaceae bacterium OttesenSCG-928-L17]|nr:hypothetical protein [Christensenellaceae bacterium OttesenSCG-928-L17]